MGDESLPVEALPGQWHATPREHPEAPSSEPFARCPSGVSPPLTVYDVRENVTLRFGVAVEIYNVHNDIHLYPCDPLTEDDIVLHVIVESEDRAFKFGNRTCRVHLHGNTVQEINDGVLTNDATGIVIHRPTGKRLRVSSGQSDERLPGN